MNPMMQFFSRRINVMAFASEEILSADIHFIRELYTKLPTIGV